ncbi:hypothetical protein ACQ4PT_028206 [Festuca glaucescens]
MDDQDIRIAFQKAKRCIARISFCREAQDEDHKYMVIPGIIVSVQNGVATIICNPEFFKECPLFNVSVPTAESYEEVSSTTVDYWGNFATFQVELRNADFVQSARFETRALRSGEFVDALAFTRKNSITPPDYCDGYIVYGPNTADGIDVVFQDCALHEYGYFGAPLFNRKGDIVGITYADRGTLIAHNVWQIRNDVLKHLNE